MEDISVKMTSHTMTNIEMINNLFLNRIHRQWHFHLQRKTLLKFLPVTVKVLLLISMLLTVDIKPMLPCGTLISSSRASNKDNNQARSRSPPDREDVQSST